jgi:hypothetical protein
VQQPTIGRIVHYVLPETGRNPGQVRPGIVVQVWKPIDPSDARSGTVNLHVVRDGCNDTGVEDHAYTAHYDPGHAPGTWHWPPRD